MNQVKRKALDQRKTLTEVVAEALAAWVQERPLEARKSQRIKLPKSGKGGLLPGIDLDSNSSLADRMDGLD